MPRAAPRGGYCAVSIPKVRVPRPPTPPFRGWHLVRRRGLVGGALFSFGSFVWPWARHRMATPKAKNRGPRTTALTPRARCAARGPNARGPGGRVPCSWPTRHGPRNLILGRGGGSREPRTDGHGSKPMCRVAGCAPSRRRVIGPSTVDRGPWIEDRGPRSLG